jgi:hypothetical protein
MAVLTLKSVQRANRDALPSVDNFTTDDTSKLRQAYFTILTAAQADIGSTIELVTLPAGRKRILLDQSQIAASAGVASGTIAVGTQAYTGFDGTAVALNATALKAATAATAAVTISLAPAAGGDPTVYIESREKVVVFASLAGGNFPTATTFRGYIVYATD